MDPGKSWFLVHFSWLKEAMRSGLVLESEIGPAIRYFAHVHLIDDENNDDDLIGFPDSHIVLSMTSGDVRSSGVIGQDEVNETDSCGNNDNTLALVSEWMFLSALKWHYDKETVGSSDEENSTHDLFSLQIRLSYVQDSDRLAVEICETDNEMGAFNRAKKIFGSSGKLQIWDFSGETNQLFLDFKKQFMELNQSNEICLELKIYGLSSLPGQLGLTGLSNIGNTCYFNSAIQCLAHTPKLINYFLGNFRKDLNFENPLGMNGKLVEEFGDLLRKLWGVGPGPVTPTLFKSTISSLAPQFKGYNQHDSQEFLQFLLDRLQENLKRVKIKGDDSRPDEEVADECWKNHLSGNDSIIDDLCIGQYCSTVVCPVCGKLSTTFDSFMFLQLALPEVCNSFDQNPVSLYQCVEAFFEDEPLRPDNMWYCPNCEELRQGKKKLDVWRLPEILIVHLKRFNNSSKKLDSFVDFPIDEFDLSNYVKHKNLSNRYVLYAVSNHLGSLDGGHYTAFVKHRQSWYKFDDSHVSSIEKKNIKTPDAYLLFYRRV